MTPREIIDKIKAHPAKERANEKLICDIVLAELMGLQQFVLNEMNMAYNNKHSGGYYTDQYIGEEEAYKDVFSFINSRIESFEYYKEHGNFGDL